MDEKHLTHEKAVGMVVTMIEEAFPNTVRFTPERTTLWSSSLSEFSPTTIVEAGKDAIEDCKFPPTIAEVRNFCKERVDGDRIEKQYAYPKDMKSLPSGATESDPFGDHADGNDNWKMVRIQCAWMQGRKREGHHPTRIPRNQEGPIRARLTEFATIGQEYYYQKVKEILAAP